MSINIIAPLSAKLYSQCIIEGTFPNILKIAQVIPIYKNGPKNFLIIDLYLFLAHFQKSLKNVFMSNCTLILLNKNTCS